MFIAATTLPVKPATPLAANVTTTGFLDPTADLVSGSEYYYTVTAVAGTTQSAPSNEAHAIANGPFQQPAVDFSKGFPAGSAGQFTSMGNVFNADSSVSVGGTLLYNKPVNASQFNIQIDFTQPNAGAALDLSLVLKGQNGTNYTVFDGVSAGADIASNFGSVSPGDQYQIQFSYSIDSTTASKNQVEGYAIDTTKGNGTSFGGNLNIPALLGGNSAQVELVSTVPGVSAKLEDWYYINSQVPPPANPIATASAAGIKLNFSNTYLAQDSDATFGGPLEVRIYRGTSPGGEAVTPITTLQMQSSGGKLPGYHKPFPAPLITTLPTAVVASAVVPPRRKRRQPCQARNSRLRFSVPPSAPPVPGTAAAPFKRYSTAA